MDTRSRYRLMNEQTAARFLDMAMTRLRNLRIAGTGPRWFRLPCGDVRYRVEDLDEWATNGMRSDVLHVYGAAPVVAFPGSGLKIRRKLHPENESTSGRSIYRGT